MVLIIYFQTVFISVALTSTTTRTFPIDSGSFINFDTRDVLHYITDLIKTFYAERQNVEYRVKVEVKSEQREK